ncbi:alpha/beta fold hydrolase, partial [Moritella sp.]|uniref:YheT family hydrolase n=1 Tax=Moritella sp. TaxID=78556 RepID=UPI0025E7F167
MTKFKPALGLSNNHLQSMLSSSGPRQFLEKRRATQLRRLAKQHIITTPQGVKLEGFLTRHNSATPSAKGLAIILHGWEGCADSLYVLSSGQKLLDVGYDVFRLNFRDHGDTHHLNPELFNSARLEEVVEAVKYLCVAFGGQHNLLCGYSLGGNFCLRVANIAKTANINLHQAIAICPVLHPPTTMAELSSGFPLYEQYFVAKWKRSLIKKLRHHPQLGYGRALKKLKTLTSSFTTEHRIFVKRIVPSKCYMYLNINIINLSITIYTTATSPSHSTSSYRVTFCLSVSSFSSSSSSASDGS